MASASAPNCDFSTRGAGKSAHGMLRCSSPRAVFMRPRATSNVEPGRPTVGRRNIIQVAGLGSLFPFGDKSSPASASKNKAAAGGGGGVTNEVVCVVNGMRQRRMGGGDIIVSEMGLGTQRWDSADFNAPDKATCHAFMDKAVLEKGVNLVDTAEQYPIPSDRSKPEGRTEQIIGEWLKKDKSRREKLVIATKITGGSNVTKRNIKKDLEGSLNRLGTDYVDLYTLQWPARYTPQSNWGQSLMYHVEQEQAPW